MGEEKSIDLYIKRAAFCLLLNGHYGENVKHI